MNKKNPFLGLTSFILLWGASVANAQASYGDEFIQTELERVVSDPENSVTISVDAPVNYVYRFLMERLDLYAKDAVTVTFNASGEGSIQASVGTERTTTMKKGGTLVQRFLIVEPPTTYAYFTDISKSTLSVPLKYSLTKYEFAEVGVTKTTVKISVVYEPSSRLTGFIVRRLFNSAFERDFNNAAKIMSNHYLKDPNGKL
tara:strand:- start:7147 stop:7749 length:603 start_codon:yes stop_codon:yes gene_type:complete